jgi:hypothetical protein
LKGKPHTTTLPVFERQTAYYNISRIWKANRILQHCPYLKGTPHTTTVPYLLRQHCGKNSLSFPWPHLENAKYDYVRYSKLQYRFTVSWQIIELNKHIFIGEICTELAYFNYFSGNMPFNWRRKNLNCF